MSPLVFLNLAVVSFHGYNSLVLSWCLRKQQRRQIQPAKSLRKLHQLHAKLLLAGLREQLMLPVMFERCCHRRQPLNSVHGKPGKGSTESPSQNCDRAAAGGLRLSSGLHLQRQNLGFLVQAMHCF